MKKKSTKKVAPKDILQAAKKIQKKLHTIEKSLAQKKARVEKRNRIRKTIFLGIIGLIIITGVAFSMENKEKEPLEKLQANNEIQNKNLQKNTQGFATPKPFPILMYHYIRDYTNTKDPVGIRLSVSPQKFEEQLQEIQKEGFETITFDDLESAWRNEKTLPEKPIMLTFNDGYRDFYENAFPLLKKYDAKATTYIATEFIGKDSYITGAQIKEMDLSGFVTIASEGVNHADLLRKKRTEVQYEMRQSKKTLEDLVGHEVKSFSYPLNRYNSVTREEVERAGYANATLTDLGYKHAEKDRFAITRVRIPGQVSLEKFKKLINQEV
ncbi:MAG: polysaccharide deacetylase family protein [Patescibacteria group bacterium]